jgi:hypothetical protein
VGKIEEALRNSRAPVYQHVWSVTLLASPRAADLRELFGLLARVDPSYSVLPLLQQMFSIRPFDVDMFQQLMEWFRVDPKTACDPTSGRSLLSLAASGSGDVMAVVRYLVVDRGVHPDYAGTTTLGIDRPIYRLLMASKKEGVRLLLDHGASLDFTI